MSGKQNFHTIDHPTTSNLTKVKKNKPKVVPKKNSQNQAPRNIKDVISLHLTVLVFDGGLPLLP
jgi:hypothetical protein